MFFAASIFLCVFSVAVQYSKTCVKRPLSKRPKIGFKTNYCLMQVKSIAECYKRNILQYVSTFSKLPFVIKIFVLSIFEWPFYTGFTVLTVVSIVLQSSAVGRESNGYLLMSCDCHVTVSVSSSRCRGLVCRV